MRVVLEYLSGKTEIVAFVSDDAYPDRIRIQRFVIDNGKDEPVCEEKVFCRHGWLRMGTPVYVEADPPCGDAA